MPMMFTGWLKRLMPRRGNPGKASIPCLKSCSFESLESRALLAATPGNFVVSFYGLGGAGGFGNDWLDNIANAAGKSTNSVVRKYDENKGGSALRDLFHSIDTNHDHSISAREVKNVKLRVVGYSFGGIQAANFARSLNSTGATIKGYRLRAAIPVRSLVTLDPVNSSPAKHTDGVPANVRVFSNFYQRKGGETKITLYMRNWPHLKLTTININDNNEIIGDTLPSAARKTKQIRLDVGSLANVTVKHKVQSQADGKLKGKDTNHGTVPFFAYDWALTDLTS